MTHDTIVALAALGVAGQVLAGALILVGVAAAAGVRAPLQAVRSALWGYELWAAFVVAAVATGGSLFFSEIAHFVPCELCWFQRICMYPLSIITLLAALAGDHRVARYLLPLPIVGAGASAGGLEAFTQLLKHLPDDTGMAFVIVQHLDPHRESMLAEILSRSTAMRSSVFSAPSPAGRSAIASAPKPLPSSRSRCSRWPGSIRSLRPALRLLLASNETTLRRPGRSRPRPVTQWAKIDIIVLRVRPCSGVFADLERSRGRRSRRCYRNSKGHG